MAEAPAESPDDPALPAAGTDAAGTGGGADDKLDVLAMAEELAGEAEPGPAALPPAGLLERLRRGLGWAFRWHPLILLGLAGGMALYAWSVFPEREERTIPPAELFYNNGVDRLARAINPDLPIFADDPAGEAAAARNAFQNLLVFHRDNLDEYPSFINPHLLLAEANRMLAEYDPAMAEKYWQDAGIAYADARLWETRSRGPDDAAAYDRANYLPPEEDAADDALAEEEVVLRRERRRQYIDYRLAEADVFLRRPETARPVLEELRLAEDSRRREALRLTSREETLSPDVPRRAFELGPDEYRRLDLLLAQSYDGLGQLGRAKGWYLRYLSSAPRGRDHAFVVERLAEITFGDGEVFQVADPVAAAGHYEAAAGYFQELLVSPSATRTQLHAAAWGLARVNSRLADLIPVGDPAGVDDLSTLGRVIRGWLEGFSGQILPRRTLAIPRALGQTLSNPEMLLPTAAPLTAAVTGNLIDMAGGGLLTPHERRRRFIATALVHYDEVARNNPGDRLGDRAAILAAQESWRLGLKEETERRYERMLDPLADAEVILAARLGLAEIALDRGDLARAHMLILGGQAQPASMWFTPADADWRRFAVLVGIPASRAQPGLWRRLWQTLPAEGREIAAYAASGRRLDDEYVGRFLRTLNVLLRRDDFYQPEDFPPENRGEALERLLARDPELLTAEEIIWRNRLLIEAALPYDVAQRASRGVVTFSPFPPGREILPDSLVDAASIGRVLLDLAGAWATAGRAAGDQAQTLRMIDASNQAYRAALREYGGDPGDILYELAHNYETQAEIRELQGDHLRALSLTAEAARSYLDVSLQARGSAREMESLLAAGDAFFRAGLLGRTIESQNRFMERFGYASSPGSEAALAVVRAENLLGRSYWFLRDTPKALASFRRNLSRRTPDRYKSIYYIGRILMEEGLAGNRPELLGSPDNPLPVHDRNGDPVIDTALQAFNYLRQSPGINPSARAWRWATFDLARLQYHFAELARAAWEADPASTAGAGDGPTGVRPWLPLYDQARVTLTEALERYPLRRNGGVGLSVRVEPEDYADVMASRFETEYLLAGTLLVLADSRDDDALFSMARAHLENMRDRRRYAGALFDLSLDRFQLNAAVIREEVEGGNWDMNTPLPRTRLGDDEGPTHSPAILVQTLRNSMLLLGKEYFRAGEAVRDRERAAAQATGETAGAGEAAAGYYQDSYRVWQDVYDRFGLPFGPEAMVNMGDCLNRLGFPDDAANHYRMARNMADLAPNGESSDGLLAVGPAFWGGIADQRLQDMRGGYTVP